MPNAFIGKKRAPTKEDLAAALGPSATLWDSLLAVLESDLQLTETDWHSYSPKAGWALRVKKGKRNIVYLVAGEEGFAANFALGDRAIEAARHSRFPHGVVNMIDTAKRYAEGTALSVKVRERKDIDVVKRLVAIKLEYSSGGLAPAP